MYRTGIWIIFIALMYFLLLYLNLFYALYNIGFCLSCLCLKQKAEGSYWIQPKSVPTCMLTNLTTIKFTKCKGRKCDLQFLEYLLGNAEVLKTVTISCKNLCIEEETRLCAQLLKFPRASRYCEIHFLGKFVSFN